MRGPKGQGTADGRRKVSRGQQWEQQMKKSQADKAAAAKGKKAGAGGAKAVEWEAQQKKQRDERASKVAAEAAAKVDMKEGSRDNVRKEKVYRDPKDAYWAKLSNEAKLISTEEAEAKKLEDEVKALEAEAVALAAGGSSAVSSDDGLREIPRPKKRRRPKRMARAARNQIATTRGRPSIDRYPILVS